MAIIKVKTGGITADAVTDALIADDVVGTEHLTANEVDTAALGADAVTGAQLADNAVNSEHYTDGSIDTAHIADNQVTLAKLAGGTDGNIISFDASGDPVAIATGNDGQVLTSTGAGSPPAFETLPVGGITEADQWRLTADKTNVSSAETLDSNWERNDTVFDKIGTGMSESSGIFSFPSTGIWYVSFNAMATSAASDYISGKVKVTTNNSSYSVRAESYQNTVAAQDWVGISTNLMVDVSNTSNVKVLFEIDSGNAITYKGNTNANYTWANFIRLGDT